MIEATITDGEETFVVTDKEEILHISNCASFTNIGHTECLWSSVPFSESNRGTAFGADGGAEFSFAHDVYLRCPTGTMQIQARSEVL